MIDSGRITWLKRKFQFPNSSINVVVESCTTAYKIYETSVFDNFYLFILAIRSGFLKHRARIKRKKLKNISCQVNIRVSRKASEKYFKLVIMLISMTSEQQQKNYDTKIKFTF